MVDNQWADPEGVPRGSKPIKYRIYDAEAKEVVDRLTEVAHDYLVGTTHHALSSRDQHIGNQSAALIQRACAYFYEPDDEVYEREYRLPLLRDVVISDEYVRARIHRLTKGENWREAERVRQNGDPKSGWYDLTALPWDQQRALIEHLTKLKQDWQFEIIGPATDDDVRAISSRTYGDEVPEHLG